VRAFFFLVSAAFFTRDWRARIWPGSHAVCVWPRDTPSRGSGRETINRCV